MNEFKTKLKKEVLWGIDFILYSMIGILKDITNKIDLVLVSLDYKWYFNKLMEFEDRKYSKERKAALLPDLSFKFKLESEDFETRHTTANKIISWYTDEMGTPSEELLHKAASVMLEDFEHTEEHVKRLLEIYKMERENPASVEANDAEQKLFNELLDKFSNKK